MKHSCRLVPRFLLQRWDSKEGAKNVVSFCRQISADEMMLFPVSQFIAPQEPDPLRFLQGQAGKIAEIRKSAKRQGINVIVNNFWFMGNNLLADKPHRICLPWAVDITGIEATGVRCLLADEVRKTAAKELVALASSGVDKIFSDDEVHYDWKPAATLGEGLHFCFCKRHIQAFSQKIGRKITREELVRRLQSDKAANIEIRREWLEFKKDTFLDFINYCRQEVHKKYPNVRLGQMTTFTHLTAWDGITFAEHLLAWAGDLQPLCRPAQGWYGDHIRTGLPPALAQTMWTLHCLPKDTEVYSEVDWGAPWTQFDSSARMSADFQIKANLLLNIKTHSLLYLGEGPEDNFLRNRLVRQMRKSRKQFDALAKELPAEARRTGLQFYMAEKMGLAYPLKCRGKEGDLADPYALTGEGWGLPPWMKAFRCLARSGVALTFDESDAAVLTGGITPLLEDRIENIISSKNLILDAGAVRDLAKMGLLTQLGLEIGKSYKYERNERLTKDALNRGAQGLMLPVARLMPTERLAPLKAISHRRFKYRIISELVDCDNHVYGAGIILVENAETGSRVCALAYNLSDENAFGFGIRKQQFGGILDWLSDNQKFPVWVDDAMDVWPILYELDGDNRKWIGLINFGHDEVNDAVCWIAQKKVSVSFVDSNGKIQKIAKKFIKESSGRTGIVLVGEHSVKAMDVLLLKIEIS